MQDFAASSGAPPKASRPRHNKPGPKLKAGIETWLTRHEAADLMRVSVFVIDKLTREGHLKPAKRALQTTRGLKEVWVYNPRELVAAEAKRPRVGSGVLSDPGMVTARAFEMFEQGKSEREVCMGCCVTLPIARELHEQWLDAGGADIVINAVGREMIETHVGAFVTIGDLAVAIDAALERAYAAGIEQGIERAKGLCEIEIDPSGPLGNASDVQIEAAILAALDAADADKHGDDGGDAAASE